MMMILVIDDEAIIVEFLQAVLEEEGYQVITAYNGEEGLACLEKVRPDIVLCDLMMPGLDGREFCQKMQAHPRYRSIPVVLMSALHITLRLIDCPYAALLSKPFDLDEVLHTLVCLLNASPLP